MAEKEMSSNKTEQLNRLARRLLDNPSFMAYVLAQFQRQERLNDDELAKNLNTPVDTLPRLALCKRPDSGSPQFADQIRQIAAYTNLDAAQLAHIVRQVDFVEKMAKKPQPNQAKELPQVAPRFGLVAAARDRNEAEESDQSQDDDESASPEGQR
jgi:hypothetical protein